MSSQRGNVSRTRKQKYQNNRAFKNDMHDKSDKTKLINNLNFEGICLLCKDIIQWKIKYNKYKPLSQPATCVRCHKKTVKKAYYTVCQPCATQVKVCAKYNTKQDSIIQVGQSEEEKKAQEEQLKFEVQHLKERQTRTFYRHIEKGENPEDVHGATAFKDDLDDDEEEDDEDSIDEDF
ncbi:uncharacterized protein C9orf85 homolog [Physella acuta]|uniref:uncharacterized protein C9orf85 homolog n=1 Tax=Physella acuta TaxID=109671 RepID=UPI0027DDD4A9|nr:uncharacterized protein C9orf85 homolog [Physella acuta]